VGGGQEENLLGSRKPKNRHSLQDKTSSAGGRIFNKVTGKTREEEKKK